MEEIEIKRLVQIISRYAEIHSNLDKLETEVQGLISRQSILSNELTQLRLEEKDIINNIEIRLGRSIDPNEILNFIKND